VTGVARARFAAVGFVGGVAAGLLVWSTQVERSRRELFSRSPLRRGLETTRLLADYVNWETRPALRRRGQLLLRRMEAHLD